MYPERVPAETRHPLADFIAVPLRLWRLLSCVPRVIAVIAGGDDVGGCVLAAMTASNQVLGRAPKAISGGLARDERLEFERRRQPHGRPAVPAHAVLKAKSLSTKDADS